MDIQIAQREDSPHSRLLIKEDSENSSSTSSLSAHSSSLKLARASGNRRLLKQRRSITKLIDPAKSSWNVNVKGLANTISSLKTRYGARASRSKLKANDDMHPIHNIAQSSEEFLKQDSISETYLEISLLDHIFSHVKGTQSHLVDPDDETTSLLQTSVRSLFESIGPHTSSLRELNVHYPALHFEGILFTDSTNETLTSVMVSSGIHAHVIFLKDIEISKLVPFDSSGMRKWIIEHSGENPASIMDTIKALSNDEASCLLVLLEFVLHCECGVLHRKHRRKAMRLLQHIVIEHSILPPTLELLSVKPAQHPFIGGGYSDVFEGSWNGTKVCVKRLRIYLRPERGTVEAQKTKVLQAFLKEALIWKQLRHPNILPFIGVSSTCFPNQMSLVSPYMKNGDIMDYLASKAQDEMPTYVKRLEWLLGASKGIRYIHSMNLCHGDIKGANILIDDDGEARLADLGISCIAASASETLGWETATAGSFKGSVRWMSPEVISSASPSMTTARDIYAFGSTILEVITGRPPWANVREDTKVILNLSEGKQPERPEGFEDDVWTIVETCWAQNPLKRPSATTVYEGCRLSYFSFKKGPNAVAATPQVSHPATHPQPNQTPPHQQKKSPKEPNDWDKIYLDVLESQDSAKLQALLARAGADDIIPRKGSPLVSQAVVLSLIDRLAAAVADPLTTDEEFKSSLWWLSRCVVALRPRDKIIAEFIPRILPTIYQYLDKAKLSTTSTPEALESMKMLTEMQDELIRALVENQVIGHSTAQVLLGTSIHRPPPPPPLPKRPALRRTSPMPTIASALNKPEPWEDMYWEVLLTKDRSKLKALLARTNADMILPAKGPHLISQAVVLTLICQLSWVVSEVSPLDEQFKSSLWWLNRCVFVLRPLDKVIADHYPLAIPSVYEHLQQANKNVRILDGADGIAEIKRKLREVQEELTRRSGFLRRPSLVDAVVDPPI